MRTITINTNHSNVVLATCNSIAEARQTIVNYNLQGKVYVSEVRQITRASFNLDSCLSLFAKVMVVSVLLFIASIGL